MEESIRQVISDAANLKIDIATLSDDDDLFEAGMTSHASVNVMLSLENEYDIEFPESMLTRAVFRTIGSLRAAVSELYGEAAA